MSDLGVKTRCGRVDLGEEGMRYLDVTKDNNRHYFGLLPGKSTGMRLHLIMRALPRYLACLLCSIINELALGYTMLYVFFVVNSSGIPLCETASGITTSRATSYRTALYRIVFRVTALSLG